MAKVLIKIKASAAKSMKKPMCIDMRHYGYWEGRIRFLPRTALPNTALRYKLRQILRA